MKFYINFIYLYEIIENSLTLYKWNATGHFLGLSSFPHIKFIYLFAISATTS